MQRISTYNANNLEIYASKFTSKIRLPYVDKGISAGFPSPADDFLDMSIDINADLIKNPDATFYGKVKGDSMIDAGIHHGDLLIIDKSLEPRNGKIAVCFIDGEFTVKRIKIEKNIIWLIAENKDYKPIKVTSENDFVIWGIVINIIKYV